MLRWSGIRKTRPQHSDADLDRELRAHLELEAEELQDHDAARRAFGNLTRTKEDTRAMWGWTAIERLMQDLRYALRAMRKNPGFTAVAVLSLALGIGANTAIFTFVNAALLKPLPYPNSERIVVLRQRPLKGEGLTPVHPRSFVPWHDRARSFEALALAQPIPINTEGADGAEQVAGLWTTSGLFHVFGVQPILGRVFEDPEGWNRAAIRAGMSSRGSVVLSHGYWQRRFGSDVNVIGRTIQMGRGTAEVIGILPAGFRVGTLSIDLFLPMPLDRNKPDAIGSRGFLCFGRLRPGVTLEEARAEMAVVADQVGRDDPNEKDWGVVVLSLRDYLVSDNRTVLLVLLGVVGFVLLIACANLASLLLTRGIGRQGELALRMSLGAGRGRLLQQLAIESMVLSGIGGALGLVAGWWASRALILLAQDAIAFGQMADVALDWRVLGFTAALSLLTAMVFGLAPAWSASRFDLQGALKGQGRGAESRGQHRLRGALVVGEVALAVVLLVGAGLLLRTFSNLMEVKLGFEPENVLTMRMIVMGDPARRSTLVESVLDRVESLPDVRAAGTIQFLPLAGFTNNGPFHFIGRPRPADPNSMESDVSTVSRGYFAAMGIPVLRGRPFGREHRLDGPRVALVNQSFVDKYSSNENPIGQRIIGDWGDRKPAEIIGVVGDIRHNGLTTEPRPTVFLAQAQVPGYITYIVVRASGNPEKLAAPIRREVQQVDRSEAVTAIQTMEHYVAASLARPRLYSVLLGTFAALALVLAAIGLYGLMAYAVSRRTHEIGIRMAVGAQPGEVLRSTLAQGMRMVLVGLAIGGVLAIGLTRFVGSLLYGVKPGDLVTYGVVAGLLGGVSLLAAYVPARRASRIDPIVALRYE